MPHRRFSIGRLASLSLLSLALGCNRQDGNDLPTVQQSNAAAKPATSGAGETPAATAAKATKPLSSKVVAKSTVPAEAAAPKPTVYGALAMAKVLDFSKLPVIKGSKISYSYAAEFQALAPGRVPAVAEFYLAKMDALGWKVDPALGGKDVSDDCASATWSKEGHIAHMTILPNDKGEAMVILGSNGNFDTRTLPRSDKAKLLSGSQVLTMYLTQTKVADEVDFVAKALAETGWVQYEPFDSAGDPTKEARYWKFMKQGYDLDVMIHVATAHENQTAVHFDVQALSHELPAPPQATQVEFDDKRWKLACNVPGDLTTAAEFYRKAMTAAGYTLLPNPEETKTHIALRFGTESGDIIMVSFSNKDGKTTRVSIQGISAKFLAEMKKAKSKP